jgi:hypothetical protein
VSDVVYSLFLFLVYSLFFFLVNKKAGLAAGTTEAVLVVSPMDLIKIRLQVKKI